MKFEEDWDKLHGKLPEKLFFSKFNNYWDSAILIKNKFYWNKGLPSKVKESQTFSPTANMQHNTSRKVLSKEHF